MNTADANIIKIERNGDQGDIESLMIIIVLVIILLLFMITNSLLETVLSWLSSTLITVHLHINDLIVI